MRCKWNQCSNEARTKSPFCSGTCKKRYVRSETDVPVEVGQEQVGQPSGTRPPCTPEQLTSSCLTCTDKPTCKYLRSMSRILPGEPDYLGIAM